MGTLYRYDLSAAQLTQVMPSPPQPVLGYWTRSAAFTVPDSAVTIIPMDSQVGFGDGVEGGAFNLPVVAGNLGWIPSQSGVFIITASLRWDNVNVSGRRQVGVYVDEDNVGSSLLLAANYTTNNAISVQAAAYVMAGQTITVRGYQNSGQAGGLSVMAVESRTFVSIVRAS